MNEINKMFVLIANYNNAKYLRGALRSVYAQTCPDWEVVICDDCSTDDSEIVYAEYANDSRIHILRNPQNMGVAYTRKRMIEETHGELMCFLDPDDELTPNALEDHIRVHTENPDVSIIFSRRYLCDRNLKIQAESRVLMIPEGETYFSHKDFREEHLVSFKKSFYNKTAGMNPMYRLAEDTYMNVMMEEVGKVYCLDKICYKYRRNGSSLTGDYARHMFWNMIVQIDTCRRRGVDLEGQVYDWYLSAVEFAAAEKIYQKELEVRNSKAYRLGHKLLRPVSWMKKLLHK